MNATSVPHCESEFGHIHLMSAGKRNKQTVEAAMPHDQTLLNVALQAAHSAPDTRQERIDHLRKLIAQGAYEIDSKSIALALVRENPGLFAE